MKCSRLGLNQRHLGFQPNALPLSYLSLKNKKNIFKTKKPTQIKTKCFQFNWVNWSNLYLGKVPRIAIAKTHINNILKIRTIYGILKNIKKHKNKRKEIKKNWDNLTKKIIKI